MCTSSYTRQPLKQEEGDVKDCGGKWRGEVLLLEVEGLQNGERGKPVMSRCWLVGWKEDGRRMGQLGLKMFAGMVEKELKRSCSRIMGLKKSL